VRRIGPTWPLISRIPRHVALRLRLASVLELGELQCRPRQPCLWRRHQTQIAPIAPRKWYIEMWRSGERYSEERRPLLLSQRVQEVSSTSSAVAVPDERVVSCADSTQNSDCPCCLAEQSPILRIPWAHSRLPSNATVMPACTQKTPDLRLSARLAICHSACYSIGLNQLFYLETDLSMFRLSAAINSAASPISHHIPASFS